MMLYNKQDTLVANRDLQRQPEVINGTLVFDEKTEDLQFVSIHDKEIRQVIFRTPQNLRYLDISSCEVESIVFTEGCCPKIKSLYLQKNNLQKIEFNIPLPELQLLDLSYNKNLQEIKVGGINKILPNLKYFYVHGCNLQDLSDFADFFIKDDVDFNIEGNENLTNPPREKVEKGKEAIKEWFEQIYKYGSEIFYEAKILIVGDPEAGKTTLRKLFFDRNTKVPDDSQSWTQGIDIAFDREFDHPEIDVKINTIIWDFGGQDIQYNLHHYFLTSQALYIVVTDERSNKKPFEYWLEIINTFAQDNTPVIILKNPKRGVKNITDYDLSRFPKIQKKLEEVTIDLSKINSEYKRAWDNFIDYTIPIRLIQLRTVGYEGAKIWKPIKEKIQRQRYRNYIEYEKFKDEFAKDMKSEDDIDYMLDYFAETGFIVYYPDDTHLRNFIFLNPSWITKHIYDAITSDLADSFGIIKRIDLDNFWKKKNLKQKERDWLFELMGKEKFDIAYPLDAEKTKYAIPQLFPGQRKEYKPFSKDLLRFKYRFKVLPYGFFSRFIVRKYELIEKNKEGEDIAWAKGVVLKYKDSRALVEEKGNEIYVSIEGAYKDDLKSKIIDTIEELTKKFDFSEKPELYIQCNCSVCRNSDNPYYYSYSTLIRFAYKLKEPKQCEISGENVDPVSLITGYNNDIPRYEKLKTDIMKQEVHINITNPQDQVNLPNIVGDNNQNISQTNQGETNDKEQKKKTKKSFTSYLLIIGLVIILVGSLIIYFSDSGELSKKISGAIAFVSSIFTMLATIKKLLE